MKHCAESPKSCPRMTLTFLGALPVCFTSFWNSLFNPLVTLLFSTLLFINRSWPAQEEHSISANIDLIVQMYRYDTSIEQVSHAYLENCRDVVDFAFNVCQVIDYLRDLFTRYILLSIWSSINETTIIRNDAYFHVHSNNSENFVSINIYVNLFVCTKRKTYF